MSVATIESREQLAPGFWYVALRSKRIAERARGAHFVALDLPGEFAARLPLGIWTAEGDAFSLLFREWGERTRRLAALPVGAEISVIGPLGNEFWLPPPGSRATIVAGGVGIVPFWLLTRDLIAAGVRVRALVGARTKAMLVGVDALRSAGAEIEICTDDGTAGKRGTVLDLLQAMPAADVLYGCGPPGMLRALTGHALAAGVRCQLSLEETFGCSLGTCWGCVVPVRRGCPQGTGYPRAATEARPYDVARVCADGTVFDAADLLWTA